MNERKWRRALHAVPGTCGLLLTVMLLLPAPAYAYTLQTGGFSGGSDVAPVFFGSSDTEVAGPSLRLLTNSTVLGGSVVVGGEPGYQNISTVESTAADFASMTSATNLTVAGGDIALEDGSEQIRLDATNLFLNSTFSNTIIRNGSVELNGASGEFVSDNISAPELGWGMFLVSAVNPPGGSLNFSLLAPTGIAVVVNQSTGAAIALNASSYPTLRVRARMAEGDGGASPSVRWVALGQIAGDTLYGNGTSRNLSTAVQAANGSVYLGASAHNLTKYGGNPIMGPTSSTFYSGVAGRISPIWNGSAYIGFFGGATCYTCSNVIGRAVSTDLINWTIDSTPVLTPTSGAWDSDSIGQPYVMENPVGQGWLMFYHGKTSSSYLSIGMAMSTDTVNWTKYSGNPVLTPRSSGWGSTNVANVAYVDYDGSLWRMWFNGAAPNAEGEYGLATSTSGTSFTHYSGNPVLPLSVSGPDDYGIGDAGMAERDGTLYLYYSCGRGMGWRICLATSPVEDGINWTKFGIVMAPTESWETNHVHSPMPYFTTGAVYVFYSSTNTGGSWSISSGVAYGQRQNASIQGLLDLGANEARELGVLSFGSVQPNGTSVIVRLRSSPDGTNWTSWESFPQSNTLIGSTPFQRYIQWQATMTAEPASVSPLFQGLLFTYSSYRPFGRYESSAFDFGLDILGAKVNVENTGGAGNIVVELSADNGTTWQRVSEGTLHSFMNATRSVMYALVLDRGTTLAPRVASVTLTVQWRSFPADVTVRLGQSGTPFLNVTGNLSGAYNVSLPASELNGAIAAALSSNPNITAVDVPFFVTSSRMGTVLLSEPRLSISLANPLSVSFDPPTLALGVNENTTTTFRAQHSVFPPSTKVNTTWWLDGVPLPLQQDLSSYNFTTNFTSAGNHSVSVLVENGDFQYNHTWSVVVYNVNRPPAFALLSPSDPAQVSHSKTLNVSAFATDADGELLTWSWSLDGQPLSLTTPNITIGPLPLGGHVLAVSVSDPFETVRSTWNVTSTNSLPVVGNQSPGPTVTLSHTASLLFIVNATDADGEPLTYWWELDGIAIAGASPARTLGSFSLGVHDLRVHIEDEFGSAVASWSVTSTNAPPRIVVRDPSADFEVSHTAWRVVSVSVVDADGEQLSYEWRLDSVVDPDETGPQFTLSNLTVGAHTLTLTVRDAYGSNSTGWVVVSTNELPVLVSASPASDPQVSHTGAVDFIVAFTDGDGDAIALQWLVDGEVVANGSSSYRLNPVGFGARHVEVRATDGIAGLFHAWDVTGTNAAPFVRSVTPAQNLTVSVADLVEVSVGAADADGDPVSYRWRLGVLPLGDTSDNVTVGPLPEGPNDLVVTVSDGRDSTFFSFRILAVNFAPDIIASNPATDFEMIHSSSRNVSVSVSDRESDPVTFRWLLDDKEMAGGESHLSVGPMAAGLHVLQVQVRDGHSQSLRTWNITLTNAPSVFTDVAPDPGNVTVSTKQSTTFTARAVDPDGDPVVLQWSVDDVPRNVTLPLALEWSSAGVHRVSLDAVSAGQVASLVWNVTVVQTNTAPVVTDVAPNASEISVNVGDEEVFAVQFDDDAVLPLTITWTVDGVDRGEGAGFVYRPTGADAGSHEVRVRLSDGEFSAERSWTVLVSETVESTSTGAFGDLATLVLGLAIGAGAGAAALAMIRRRPSGGKPG